MLVTSFSPTRIEAQEKAVKSWKRLNLEFTAVQCIGEDYAKDFTDNIIWVKPNLHWSKRTPSLQSIFQSMNGTSILINSDIELEQDALKDWEVEEGYLKLGLRTDYGPSFSQLNKYGIDVYLITPEMLPHITDNSIWALGIPGWDYWVVWKLINNGFKLDVYKEGFRHEFHKEQWNNDDYRRCAKLLEFEFDIPIQDISDTLQQLTERTQLTKRQYFE